MGSVLAIENLFSTPAELAGMLGRLPDEDVGVCLDVGHAHALSRTPLESWFELLGDRIVQFHVHDNHGVWDEHLGVGQGSIDFDAFSRLAAGLGRDLPWVIEARDEAAARLSVGVLRQGATGGV